VAPALRATVEPLPNIKVSEAEDKDLDGNEEVLGPLLEENGDRREAAEQERNKEDNRSIALSALTASNEDLDDISNIGDNSDWLLTLGESFNKEDEDSNDRSLLNLGTTSVGDRNLSEKDYNLANRLQRKETPANYTLSNDDGLSPNYLPILI